MTRYFRRLFSPGGPWGRILFALVLISLFLLDRQGAFEFLQAIFDTPDFTYAIGKYQLSVYDAIRNLIALTAVFWAASIIVDVIRKRVDKITRLRRSNRDLINQLVKIGIYFIAFMMALNIIGIDITALAVFSGALGIGLGFGLQKTAANFISGMILLAEKSVEVDDLIELTDGTAGFVRNTTSRFVLMETFDGKEIIIPNEELMVNRVINWTYSNQRGRVEVSIGVSYQTDLDLARDLIVEGVKSNDKVLSDPEPRCFLTQFADSSVNFQAFFWIDHIHEYRLQVRSEVMFAIWHRFADHGIKIPYPQRDLHLYQKDGFAPKSPIKRPKQNA
jgi:small-conductance mechanosensitive channel